jgi:hypothetical protein
VRREDLHYVVAAAARIVGEDEWVIVGSQAILGPYPDAPAGMLRSMEADLYPRAAPDKAVLAEGSWATALDSTRRMGTTRMGRP